MPTVADIRSRVGQKEQLLQGMQGQLEWEEALRAAADYSPVPYWKTHSHWNNPPQLSDAGHYAIRCIGGYERLSRCTDRDLPFVRKDFMEAYQRHHEGERLGISDSQAKKLLNDILGTSQKALKSGKE